MEFGKALFFLSLVPIFPLVCYLVYKVINKGIDRRSGSDDR